MKATALSIHPEIRWQSAPGRQEKPAVRFLVSWKKVHQKWGTPHPPVNEDGNEMFHTFFCWGIHLQMVHFALPSYQRVGFDVEVRSRKQYFEVHTLTKIKGHFASAFATLGFTVIQHGCFFVSLFFFGSKLSILHAFGPQVPMKNAGFRLQNMGVK